VCDDSVCPSEQLWAHRKNLPQAALQSQPSHTSTLSSKPNERCRVGRRQQSATSRSRNTIGDPRDCVNGFYAYAVPYYYVVPRECVETGAHIWIVETRRAPNAAIDQTVKNFNRMDLTKGTFEALDRGADAAVLLSTDGYVAEGPGFNVWIVRGNALVTPAGNLLEGITRRAVFDLAEQLGVDAKTANLTAEELSEANEAFLSTTAGGIIPISRVNDRPLGNGAPGLRTTKIQQHYWEQRRAGWHGTSVNSLIN
jgi:branched-chain amino acid aminotransferase